MTDLRTKEAIRYLGYGKHAVDEGTLGLISDSFRDLEACAAAKSIYRIFECEHTGENELQIGKMNITSRSLGRNLKGCGSVVLLGATLGTGVDLMMKRFSLTDMAKTVVLQACAAAYLDIHHQKDILQMLDTAKTIGLTMTDSYMLTPVKSVTALIGISDSDEKCHIKGCESCGKTDCIYRRN